MTRARPRSDARTPNLFVIGAPKSGTTTLHAALASSPVTFMSAVKEPGFFSSDRQFARGLDHYLGAYFAGSAGTSVRGESTPWYLYSEKATERIGALGSDSPHFVVLLRRPADRAYSMYLDQQRIGNETRSFPEAVEQEIKEIETGDLTPDVRRRHVWCGLYTPHLRRWIDRFGAERVHIHLTDDLRVPDALWQSLAGQVGCELGPEQISTVPPGDRNTAGPLRWPLVDRAVRSLEGRDSTMIRSMRRVVPRGWDRRLAQAIFARNQSRNAAPPATASRETMSALDEYFRTEVTELQTLIGRPLDHWMPDNIRRE